MLGLFKWIESELRWRWGVVLAAGYALCFTALRPLSTDQWYLPAGLRVAALLIVPYRFWPYLFVGEVSALVYARHDYADAYGWTWLLISSMVLMPAAAGILRWHQKRLGSGRLYWFLSVALLTAAAVSVLNNGVAYWLVPASAGAVATWQTAFRFLLGDYLGIFMLAPLALMWKLGDELPTSSRRLSWDAGGAAVVIAGLFVILALSPDLNPDIQYSIRLLMIVPAAVLTFLHGWRGAAVGVAMVNLAVGLTMQRVDVDGTHDPAAFQAQEILALSATILFGLGAVISRYSSKVRYFGEARMQAIASARSSYAASERELQRRKRDFMRIGDGVRRAYADAAQTLHEAGQHRAALTMLNEGAERSREIRNQLILLYPEEIEMVGLYRALSSGLIAAAWQREGRVHRSLRGKPELLSFDLQLAAYRTICDLVGLLQQAGHRQLSLKVRCSTRRRGRGIVISVSQTDSSGPGFTFAIESIDDAAIAGRVIAYGGVVHRRSHRISLLMVESTNASSKAAGAA